jgi:hypothetical protein
VVDRQFESKSRGERLTLRVLVAQCLFSHVGELDSALGGRVAEQVARDRVELGRRDDFCQLLHVGRLDVEDVCAPVRTSASRRSQQERHSVEGDPGVEEREREDALKDWSEMLRFQRLIRRSSALMYVSPSELTETELMWYACALA